MISINSQSVRRNDPDGHLCCEFNREFEVNATMQNSFLRLDIFSCSVLIGSLFVTDNGSNSRF